MNATAPELAHARIAIVGAGPTGLGAAHRLNELGLSNFAVFEKQSYAGGLAASFVDAQGFTWDIGGHVLFSHYGYFDRLMDSLLGCEWLHHQRESWIWILERFVPYPFQNNIRHLPPEAMKDCLAGLIRAHGRADGAAQNFHDWIVGNFGEGIARHFLLPYNFKVWAHPAQQLSAGWVGQRVARVDLERIVFNILEQRDDRAWGPNNTFRFPARGGTGEIWRRLANSLPKNAIRFNRAAQYIDTGRKRIHFADGASEDYDILISTMPIDVLVRMSDLHALSDVANGLRRSTVHVVGVGLKGTPPPSLATKSWLYFPEDTCPFYRVTVFSNYSKGNVPEAESGRYWSLMAEVSESPAKPVEKERVVDSVLDGMLATRLVERRDQVAAVWYYCADYGYPVPSIGRDAIVGRLMPVLEQRQVFSRGRFGAWKYEVSNQDHSLMQGVELVDRLAGNCEELTLNAPDRVNRSERR